MSTETVRRGGAWRIVAAREIAVKVRDRGFIISTVATLAIILGAMAVQAFVGSGGEKISIATVGDSGSAIVKQAESLADQADQDITFSNRTESSLGEVRSAVRSGDVDAGLVETDSGWQLIGKTDKDSTAATWIGSAVQSAAVEQNAAAAGTTVEDLVRGGTVDYTLLTPDDTPETVVRVSTYVFGFLFYLAAVILGVSLATSIVEEKQNRIVEIIASAISLRDLLVGKIVGSTLIGLAQMLIFSVVAVAGLLVTGKTETLSQITGGLGWFLVFYAVGIAVLACVYAAAGAIATRSEDIQSTTTPVTMITAVVFIAGISATGTFQTVLSFLPLSSTITMPGRVVAGDTMWWEPVLALLISLAAAIVVVLLSERIYRRALMQTGSKLSFRQALRLQD